MTRSLGHSLGKRAKYTGWSVLTLLILYHLSPSFFPYELPHFDYFNVMHVINYLQSPQPFGADQVTKVITEYSTLTAPLYFYGLTYPLSFLLPAKWVLLTLGFAITSGCAYFAGGHWTSWRNLLVSTVVLLVLLHVESSPIEGNRRSFTAFFLLGILWLEDRPRFLARAFLVGLASGIYPPVALMMLAYTGCRELLKLVDGTRSLRRSALIMLGLCVVFLAVLTPYWSQLLFTDGFAEATDMGIRVEYELSSISGWFRTFVVGERGAFFRDLIQLDVFFMLGILMLIEWSVLGKRFSIQTKYILLILSSLGLWFLAHLLHPLIYHPFKYTRISFLIGLAFPVAESLPSTIRLIHGELTNETGLRWMIVLGAIPLLFVWLGFVLYTERFILLLAPEVLGEEGWKFLFGLLVFLAVILTVSSVRKKTILRSFLAVTVLFGLVFLPHDFPRSEWREMHISNFEGMYEFLRTTPHGTLVAGPPVYFLDPIPTYARRGIYASTSKIMFNVVCNRIRSFWNAYFALSMPPVVDFMNKRGIDFLLVDRKLLNERRLLGSTRCMGNMSRRPDPFLDQHFEDAAWSYKRRFYLVSPSTINNH